MAEATPRRRKAAAAPARRTIKISVPIDADTYVRLAAAAAMAGRTHGALVADLVVEHVRGLVIFDKRKLAGHGDPSGSEESAA